MSKYSLIIERFNSLKNKAISTKNILLRENLIVNWLKLKSRFRHLKFKRFFCKFCLTPFLYPKTIVIYSKNKKIYNMCKVCNSNFSSCF